MKMSLLTAEQQEAFDAIASGHNVTLMGQAGTGKTFLVREAVSRLRNAGKTVAVTASTGMAARQYAQQGGTTIHHWAGMLDGRYDNQYLLRRLEAADDQSVIKRINETDVLLIDEISMISAKTFEQVSLVSYL